jgi:hypothetical protein
MAPDPAYVDAGNNVSEAVWARNCMNIDGLKTSSSYNWSTSSSSVATVPQIGLIHGVAAGTSTIASWVNVKSEGAETCPVLPVTQSAQVRVRPRVTGQNTVWWFNGQSPTGYNTQATLTSSSPSTWTISSGADKVQLSSASGTETMVTPTGTAFSGGQGNDVSIIAMASGQTSAPFLITVLKPTRFVPTAIDPQCDVNWGYRTVISYSILDQLGRALPADVDANEQWTSGPIPDYSGNNWGQPTANEPLLRSFRDLISDEITGPGVNNSPPNNPSTGCPGTAVLVQHWGQLWRIGSNAPGTGVLVQSDILQRYTDHGAHSSIVSPVP